MFESEFERNLYALRQEKLKQIAALGQQAYPNTFAPEGLEVTPIPRIRAGFDVATGEQLEGERVQVAVAGRIMAIRQQGKAGFATLQQEGKRLQIYVRKDAVGDQAFELYKLLDLGDHIGVTGYLFRTRTNELTVHVETITFLAKALLALPEKYHGLSDVELRYRQRYVDLFMNGVLNEAPAGEAGKAEEAGTAEGRAAESGAAEGRAAEGTVPASRAPEIRVREVFVKRAAVLRAMRKFFDARGYIEVETPMMQPIAGGAAARPFVTHHNTLDMDLFLRIAPELYLKRLVVGGFDRVYEINRNFRNEGISTQHNPEFTMLEFYQAYANYRDLIELTKELIESVALEVNGTTVTHFNGVQIDLAKDKWATLTMREAIVKWWPEGAERPSVADLSDRDRLAGLVRHLHNHPNSYRGLVPHTWTAFGAIEMDLNSPSVALGKSIATLFELVAEEKLIQPTIIYEFPLAVSPLSKQKPDEPEWVERFEFYIGGFELGNAFSELNDPEEQRRRFEEQVAQHEHGDEEAHQMDIDYVRALGYGLPPTAGEGIGIDRLTMILTGARSIRDVILFPLLKPQAGESSS